MRLPPAGGKPGSSSLAGARKPPGEVAPRRLLYRARRWSGRANGLHTCAPVTRLCSSWLRGAFVHQRSSKFEVAMRWVELDWLHDAEILGRLDRHPLPAILDLLAPALAQQGVTLPDLRLPVKGSTHSLDSAEK